MKSDQTDTHWRARWPKVIVEQRSDEAVDLIQRYFAFDAEGKPNYTGAQFERIAGLNNDPNAFGPADFVAVSMLSVTVPADSAIRLLGRDAARATSMLRQIPVDLDILDADDDVLTSSSAAGQLWSLLRDPRDGLGRTKTSKLLAVKRPRLIPIWDQFVEQATGVGTQNHWRNFRSVLTADDRAVWTWLAGLRSQVPDLPPSVSHLRLLDVLLWMSVSTVR
ncbi:hypothetical protein H7K45_12665 [Mycobacterium yunnanensis]|uniref:Uncharacterized protein n=1 Tax=Mycobacterium yunnanensis TaxID=368477 RepID=A0A9X2Z1Y4_9MYCO|nr:DUF6308 family protein [Mycobacterium yunnanensis]MCV7421396.1 hypothetical protein [Mycobacterium yunnanensis]